MKSETRQNLFDRWASSYAPAKTAGFPFEGYGRVLETVVARCNIVDGMTALDVGTGDGALAALLVAMGCRVWGIDFSPKMLERAMHRVPEATFIRADLLSDAPLGLPLRFDAIVSGYVLHEFDLPTKVKIIRRLFDNELAPGGRLVVGDIAFATRAEHDRLREDGKEWDHEEHYWILEEAIDPFSASGLSLSFEPVSMCAGVIQVERCRTAMQI